jgi:tryptophan-rich sensory protein
MKRIEIKDLVINILIPVASGTLIGLIFKDYTSSIEEFNRSIVVPPIIFPIVWSVLYILMGVWFYFFGMEASTKQKIYYYALLGVNLLFTPVLFYFKNITLSLVITLILLIGNSYLFINYLKKDKKSYILLPYLIWLVVANILMLDLFINNVLK